MSEVLGHLRVGDYEVQHAARDTVSLRRLDPARTGVYPEYQTVEIAAEDFEAILASIVEELR